MRYLFVIAAISLASLVVRADDQLFVNRVAPVLARRCLACHNPEQRKEDVSLATGLDLFEAGHVIAGATLREQVQRGFYRALGREALKPELDLLVEYAAVCGLANCCRVLFNLNEFSFVD